MEVAGSTETMSIYRITRRHIPDERILNAEINVERDIKVRHHRDRFTSSRSWLKLDPVRMQESSVIQQVKRSQILRIKLKKTRWHYNPPESTRIRWTLPWACKSTCYSFQTHYIIPPVMPRHSKLPLVFMLSVPILSHWTGIPLLGTESSQEASSPARLS